MPSIIKGYSHHLRNDRRMATRTIGQYVPIIRAFLSVCTPSGESANARRNLPAIDRAKLVTFLGQNDSHGRPPSATLWNARLTAIRSFSAYLLSIGLVAVNIAATVERQRQARAESAALHIDDVRPLVVSARTQSTPLYRSRNVAVVVMLARTGLAPGALVSLDVGQVDLALREVVSVHRGRERKVPLDQEVAAALTCYLSDRGKLNPVDGEHALLLSDRGTRLSIRSVQVMVGRFARAAGAAGGVTPRTLQKVGLSRQQTEAGAALDPSVNRANIS